MANRRSSASQLPPPGRSSGRHPIYHGIRLRGGKWASEIREPNKSTRIWLGTFPTPEMAAAAYDVAALALRGPNARLNLPDSVLPNTLHEGSTADDIRAAAARAAASRSPAPEYCENDGGGGGSGSMGNGGFMDDDETVFDTPMSMVMEMAEGMLLSPPRMEYISPEDESSVYYSGGGSLWNY